MRLLTIPQAAKRLGLSLPITRELVARGDLPVKLIKQRVRIPEDLLLAWSQQTVSQD